MNSLKLVFSLKNKKTFSQALGFYLFHALLIFIVILIGEIFFFMLTSKDGSFDATKVMIFTKLSYTVYLILVSIFVIKNRVSKNKIGYLCFMLIGAIVTYILNPWLGFLFLAYITTLGEGKSEAGATII